VAADDVAGLVREHADQLIGVVASISAPALTKMCCASMTKAFERLVVDDDDSDALIAQAGDLEDRRYVFAQQLLDLGIANHRDAALEPFWARAGTEASATAAAVTNAMAREAGFTGRTLLGDFAGFIWDSFGPSVGTRAMDAGTANTRPDTVAAPKPSATKAAEYGSSGAAPSRPKSGT